jgi:heat shock protein HslJ
MTHSSRSARAMLCALFLGGCSTMPDAAGPDRLADSAWTLSALAGEVLAEGPRPTLAFADGRASGSDGCNRYQAGYRVDGERFALAGDAIATRMACPDAVMRTAATFMQALADARGWRLDGGRLELLDAAGATLAAFDAQATSLAGTRWRATAVNNGRGAVAGVDAGLAVTLEFSDDGLRASGLAACNRYSAAVAIDGASVSFGPAAASKMMCGEPAGVMQLEQQFLAALATVASARVEGDQLELRTQEGALAAMLVREAAP